MGVAQADQELAPVEDRAVDHRVQPLLDARIGDPLVVTPDHRTRLGVHPEDVLLRAADDLPAAVPLHHPRSAVGGLVAEALGLPDHLPGELVEGGHADLPAAGSDDDLVAVDQRMLADALVIGGDVVLVPVVERPAHRAVSKSYSTSLVRSAWKLRSAKKVSASGIGLRR